MTTTATITDLALKAEEAGRRGKGRYGKDFIFGGHAPQLRAQRGPAFVTIVEMAVDEYVELDADSADHGVTLANTWLSPEHFRAMSASVWAVKDGRLVKRLALLPY